MNPESHDFWTIYFVEPKGPRLDFNVVNYSQKTEFQWEAIGSNIRREGKLEIKKGAKAEIKLEESDFESGKVLIKVTSGSNTREIYKYLNL